MKKPEKIVTSHYDWTEVWEYLRDKYGLCSVISSVDYPEDSEEFFDIWNYLVDANDIKNGAPFTISDWELKHNDGEFAYMIPEFFKPILGYILDEFGEIDTNCLTPNTRTATFVETW